MSAIEELQPGSYAEIPFLTRNSAVSGGRKVVVHEFPNSDNQTVEDLGLKRRTYPVTAIITTDSNNQNYIQRRDSFIRVLEKGGADVLVHPYYGRLTGIYVGSYTVSENLNRVGEAVFNIQFLVDTSLGTPQPIGDTIANVNKGKEETQEAVRLDVGNNIEVSNEFPDNFTSLLDKANNIVNAFEENASFLSVSADKINEFSSQLNAFGTNITLLVNNPLALSTSVTNLFETVNGLYNSTQATFEVMQKFFTFGDEDFETPILENTAGRIERAKNQNLINSLMQTQALAFNYQNASNLTFSTVNEVDAIAGILENQYQKVNGFTDLETATLSELTALRTSVQDFLDEAKLNASQIISARTKQLPARVISYQYYEDSSLGQSLAELNKDINVSFIEGDIEIFTA